MNGATGKIKISAKAADALLGYSDIGEELPEPERCAAWASINEQITADVMKAGGVLVLNEVALTEIADWADYEADMADLDQHDYNALALGAYKAMMRGLANRANKALGQIAEAGK